MAGKLVHVEIKAADVDRAHGGIPSLLERLLQLPVQKPREGVELVGAVERDRLHAAVAADLDLGHRYASSRNSTVGCGNPRLYASLPVAMNSSLRIAL